MDREEKTGDEDPSCYRFGRRRTNRAPFSHYTKSSYRGEENSACRMRSSVVSPTT